MRLLALLLALAGQDSADDLLRRLGSDSIEERDAASQKLRDLGEAARPALERASKDPDSEVARRAAALLRRLALRGRLSPQLRAAIPGAEDRLADGALRDWTTILVTASRHPIPREDYVLLGPQALRGAATPDEKTAVFRLLQSRRIREAIPEALALLADPDPNVSRTVATGLLSLDGPELRRGLVELLASKSAASRAQACGLLADLRAAEILPALVKLLPDPSLPVKKAALQAIVRFRAIDHAPAVVELLKDGLPGAREEAAMTLRRLDARATAPAVVALLADGRPEVRVAALRTLEFLRVRDPAIARRCADPDPAVRAAATWALGPGETPLLVRLLLDEAPEVRVAAAWGLGRARAREASEGLVRAVSDPDPDVQAVGAWASGTLELRAAAPALIKALDSRSTHARTSAAWAAGRLRLKEAVPRLLKMLESNPRDEEAQTAAWALGQIRAPEALGALLDNTVANPKRRIKEPRAGTFLALRAYPPADVLREAGLLLQGKDSSRRAIAAEALRAVGSAESKPLLLELLSEESAPAARALGEMGAREAIPRLLAILEDEDSDARGAAAYALSLLGAKEALPALRRAVQDPDRDLEGDLVRALERFGDDESRDFVISGLSNYRDEGIFAAAMWLCREGRKAAVQPLLDESEVYVPLNGLRRPAEWKALSEKRLEGDLEGTLFEVAERIGSAAGLAIELERDDWDPDVSLLLRRFQIPNPGGRLTAAEALFELVRLLDTDYEAIVEPGRLRFVPYKEASEFWDRWGAEALRK